MRFTRYARPEFSMRLLRLILIFAIGWSVAMLPLTGNIPMAEADHMAMPEAGNMVMAEGGNLSVSEVGHMGRADNAPGISEFLIGPTHDCCDQDQAPADHMKNCQVAACAKCVNFFYTLLSAPIIHPSLDKAEAWLTPPEVFSLPYHLPYRPPRV